MPGAKAVVEAAGREVTVSNPEKVFFLRTGHTKSTLCATTSRWGTGRCAAWPGGRWR